MTDDFFFGITFSMLTIDNRPWTVIHGLPSIVHGLNLEWLGGIIREKDER
jgi:hypothetical protein